MRTVPSNPADDARHECLVQLVTVHQQVTCQSETRTSVLKFESVLSNISRVEAVSQGQKVVPNLATFACGAKLDCGGGGVRLVLLGVTRVGHLVTRISWSSRVGVGTPVSPLPQCWIHHTPPHVLLEADIHSLVMKTATSLYFVFYCFAGKSNQSHFPHVAPEACRFGCGAR